LPVVRGAGKAPPILAITTPGGEKTLTPTSPSQKEAEAEYAKPR
jgi:hypothetical protein